MGYNNVYCSYLLDIIEVLMRKGRLKALPHVTISSTMVFNVAKIESARASSTISLTKSLRVAGPLELNG